MNGDNWDITRAEGGFIVYVRKPSEESAEGAGEIVGRSHVPRVFADSSALLNYLHNELVGSN